jgi:hypothetical protein
MEQVRPATPPGSGQALLERVVPEMLADLRTLDLSDGEVSAAPIAAEADSVSVEPFCI